MQKRWVKWVAVILAVIFILTSVGAVGFSIIAGQ
ncbi:MAG TPA: transcriptional regulator [Ruminiclostridium sp.]